jgi:hypothetical protein
MLAILRGDYQIAGFTNRALQAHLAGWNSQKTGRVLKRLGTKLSGSRFNVPG